MKFLFVFAVVFVVAHAGSLEEQWQEFKLNHGKTYKSLLEEKRRFAIFQDNVRTIEKHNEKFLSGEVLYSYGVNQFSDLTAEEFAATLSEMPPKPEGIREVYNATNVASDNVNWVTAGLVTPVKNQLRCGSCWAFSTVGAIEGQVKKHGGELISLSPQNLVDCDRSYNNGCNGGLMDYAFTYVKSHGVLTEAEYPYVGHQQRCQKQGGQKVSGYVDIANNEAALLSALSSVGPISVAIEANELQHYSSGIFDTTSGCNARVNHGVLLVGAGSEDGKNYWLIKNSWGASWGENGYFRLINGKRACGITTYNSYPKL